ncbi:TRAM1-domain-containing protein [Corynespora cassiicola Philippines]|uniref:TRAM1-domain-containing protein n=1 Tax=Corynespora cassiicola Philippines TaxID=1448308 RepID=A0A2T2N0K6_CORCC|nr:TRAM1-domain-containing protein [Corynespora cassiicola Philippines]
MPLPDDEQFPQLNPQITHKKSYIGNGTTERGKPSGRRSERYTIRSVFFKTKSLCLRHTWLIPLALILHAVSLYIVNPVPSNPLAAGIFLSYPLPQEAGSDAPIHYGKGRRDFAFVGFYTIVLTFTRELFMQRIIKPFAVMCGIKSKAKQNRFMEQCYTAIYVSIFGPFGTYVMSQTPIWYFDTAGMYEGFPHKTHHAVFKTYYLLQAAYWTQQMVVLLFMLEKPRKDFRELVAHYVITLALIWLSYWFHFTYMGIAVYITMDISEFFLAYIAFALLSALQAVNLFWWLYICRIAYRFVVTKTGIDERSESENEVEPNEKSIKPYGINSNANDTPKVLVNGEYPSTLDQATTVKSTGSIISRMKHEKED